MCTTNQSERGILQLQVRGHQRVPSDSKEFHEMTKKDALRRLEKELDKQLQTANEDCRDGLRSEMARFSTLFDRFLQEEGPSVDWEKMQKLPEDAVRDYAHLQAPPDSKISEMLNKLVVIKLNGGLGTSMGCHGPKSVIPVRNDLTFLDLTVQQIEHLNKTYNSNVPLVLMNSFNTDEDTEKVIRKYKEFQVNIYCCGVKLSTESSLR